MVEVMEGVERDRGRVLGGELKISFELRVSGLGLCLALEEVSSESKTKDMIHAQY